MFFLSSRDYKRILTENRTPKKTSLSYLHGFNSFYNPLKYGRIREFIEGKRDNLKMQQGGYPARLFLIDVGDDYHGSLELPHCTESVEVFNLSNGNQVIEYSHDFIIGNKKKYFIRILPFANEMRSKDNRLEVVDLIPEETRTFDELVKAEPDFSVI